MKFIKIILFLVMLINISNTNTTPEINLFVCGDVMTGRGIDQILPHPGDPEIYESYMKNARGYVQIAEEVNGPIPDPVSYSYIWGDAMDELKKRNPDVKLINLETSITKSNTYWKGKGINYRMHPRNIKAITSAGINCCSLANNHTLDWGYKGFQETIETLKEVNLSYVGAGKNIEEASAPVIFNQNGIRILVFGVGMINSGIPPSWKAGENTPGLYVFSDYSDLTVEAIKSSIKKYATPDDIIVLSIHWGGNWGYEITQNEKDFARKLIDRCDVDVIHGHSSHHAKGLEVYNKKLILYGCGDFINDYEGISGHEAFRPDLSLMYFLKLDTQTGNLKALEMVPMQIKKFSLHRAKKKDVDWLKEVLNREYKPFGLQVSKTERGALVLEAFQSKK